MEADLEKLEKSVRGEVWKGDLSKRVAALEEDVIGEVQKLAAPLHQKARSQPLKKESHAGYPLVGYHPLHLSLAFFFQGSM